jgi:hypothetical protein
MLNVRLNAEEDNTISRMSSLLTASTSEEMIDAGRPMAEVISAVAKHFKHV